jgi:hypothetical protein
MSDVTGSVVKQKWAILRDVFRRELKKNLCGIPGGPDGQTISYKSRWIYFPHMLFLKDVMQVSENADEDEPFSNMFFVKSEDLDGTELKENYSSTETAHLSFISESCAPSEVISEDSVQGESILVTHDTEMHGMASENSNLTRKRSYDSPTGIELMNTKKQIFPNDKTAQYDMCDHTKVDDDYHFLMSLLPFLRRTPESQKLKLRMRLIQAVQGESKSDT